MTSTPEIKACVTGASGFVGAQVVATLLDRGHHVRATVRSPEHREKYDFLDGLPGAGERLELVPGQLLEEGSYDDAVRGCQWVFHCASPYTMTVADPQRDLVDPAVLGTRNVLTSCKHAGTVQRVVVTSSMAAVTDEPRPGHVYTEDDWNESSSLTRNPYYFSKVKAEKEAWRFLDEGEPGFSVVVINPVVVIGPSLVPSLNTSNQILRDLVAGGYPAIVDLTWGMVDVRDVAEAHVRAAERGDATGRFVCAAETRHMRDVVRQLRELGWGQGTKLPRIDLSSSLGTKMASLLAFFQPAGIRSYLRTHLGRSMQFDNGKIRERLELSFRPLSETIEDTMDDLVRWGHLAVGPVPGSRPRPGPKSRPGARQDERDLQGWEKLNRNPPSAVNPEKDS
jgi:dihydroflavonol-4-reductase